MVGLALAAWILSKGCHNDADNGLVQQWTAQQQKGVMHTLDLAVPDCLS